MTKNKKIALGVVTTLALVAAPIATVVSCGGSDTKGDVFFVSDGGSISDKSFNQQGAEAVKEILGEDKIKSSQYNEPKSHDAATITQGYEAALNAGKKIIVGTGFYHDAAVQKWVKDQKDVLKFILADVSGDNAAFHKNVAGIQYKTRESGYLAGYLAAKFLVEVKKDTSPKVGTFGGANIPSVTDFMVGFINGVKKYNDSAKPANLVKFAPLGTKDAYTNSGFASGGGKAKATELLKLGADIILPVAGPQTADVLGVLNDGQYVIGVDTDQKLKYPGKEKFFLTSIVKNIKDSIIAVYNKVSGKDAKPWAKGYGETTFGDLSNGLTSIAVPGIKSAESVYKEVLNNKSIKDLAVTATKNSSWDDAYSVMKGMM